MFYDDGGNNLAGIESCCKDCEDRQLGCHSLCEKYKKFKEYVERKKQELNKVREDYDDGYKRRRWEPKRP